MSNHLQAKPNRQAQDWWERVEVVSLTGISVIYVFIAVQRVYLHHGMGYLVMRANCLPTQVHGETFVA